MRKLVFAVLLLAGLLVAADFGTAAAAEYQVATKLRSEFQLTRDPAVRIHGFPFLTQALSGDYQRMDVQATGLPVGPLTDVAVEANLYDVTAPLDALMSGSLSNVQIDEVEGRVRIKDTDIGRAIGIEDLRIAQPSGKETESLIESGAIDESDSGGSDSGGSDSGGSDSGGSDSGDSDSGGSEEDTRAPVRLAATTDLVGKQTEVIIIGTLELDGKVVRVKPADVRLATDDVDEFSLPSSFREPVLDVFTFTINPGSLPFTATPESIHVETGAVLVEGTANDVSFSHAGLGSR